MGKIRLARVSIAELKRRIEIAEHRKKCLEEYLHNLWNSYQKGLVSRDFYVETAHRHFEGKTLKEWIDYYDDYIKECERHLGKHRKNLVTGHLSVFFFSALLIFFVFIFYSSFGFKLTGFAIVEEVDFEDWESYADADVTIAGSAWTNVAGDDCDWQVDSAGTPSTGTGPNIDHTLGTTSGKYFYMETSSGWCQTPSPGSTSIVNSTESYDADAYTYNVSFWYHMFGSTIGTLYFEVYNGSWNTEWSITGQQHASETTPYTQATVDLSAYSGTIQFRFRGVQAGQYYSDFAIDDINISRTASNSPPTTPTNISCNNGECNISVDTTVNINASGSTDSDADDITYFVDASLQNITTAANATDVSMAATGGGGGCSGGSCDVAVLVADAGAPIARDGNGDGYIYLDHINSRPGWTATFESTGTLESNAYFEANYDMVLESYDGHNDISQLESLDIPIVICDRQTQDMIKITAADGTSLNTQPDVDIVDNSHYITQEEAEAQMTIQSSNYEGYIVSWGGDEVILATIPSQPTQGIILAVDKGDMLYDGTTPAAERRVYFTPGYYDSTLTANGYRLLNRTLDWAVYADVASTSNETNTTETTYTDVNSDFKSVTNITVTVETDSFDPRASVDQSTNNPDLWLEIYNGTGWVDIGNFDLPSTYTGTGLDTTNYNFSLTTTDSGILSGWQTSTNQDLRIKGVYMDHNETLPDEINYTNIWITINGKQWGEIGNHTESTNLTWNTTDLDEQTGIDLRARAIDIDGTNTYSSYFTKNSYLNISHGAPPNQAPTIEWVESISAQDPVESSTRSITFNFTATDTNGMSDIDNSTAAAYFQRAGESTRSNSSCNARNASTNSITFTCTIDMWYFDQNGAWTINVTVEDNSAEYAENSSTTLTYNLLTAMAMSPTALNWPEINLPDTDIGATNDPITLNNTGNDENLNINITAYNLQGETITTQYIFANNFTVGDTSQGCSGTAMQNATSTNVTSAILYHGNNSLNYNNATSGQEQIFFCLKEVPQDISAQSYSSSAYGAWEIKILLVAIIPAGRRRKKKLRKSNKILKLLIKLTDELRKEYSKEKETIIYQLIKAVQKEYGVKRKEVLDLIREREIKIPIAVFSKKLGALESLVKYMKENLSMGYKEISEKLLRNERTIWTAYQKASEKQPNPMKIKKTKEIIPLSIFKNKRLTILESIILYLKKKEMRFSEIAGLLERDQRNIWTIYSRAIKKQTNERE